MADPTPIQLPRRERQADGTWKVINLPNPRLENPVAGNPEKRRQTDG